MRISNNLLLLEFCLGIILIFIVFLASEITTKKKIKPPTKNKLRSRFSILSIIRLMALIKEEHDLSIKLYYFFLSFLGISLFALLILCLIYDRIYI